MAPESGTTVTLARTFAARRERLFRAWTDPAILRRWVASGGDASEVAVDLRPGGHYRLATRDPHGDEHIVGGHYRVIEPIARLVFSWRPAHTSPSDESNVSVDLHARGDVTEVVVRHDGLPSAAERARAEHYWRARLERLAAIL